MRFKYPYKYGREYLRNSFRFTDCVGILNKNIKIYFLIVCLFYSFNSFSQSRKELDTSFVLHGRIVNERDEAIPGATVSFKGKESVAITDSSGSFVLKGMNSRNIIIISGVNIETLEARVESKSIPIIFRVKTKVKTESEVIVEANTGYQKIKPNEVTGSIAVIDNKTLNQQVGSNILNRLNGVASSVLFPSGKIDAPNFFVRGLSTINGPKSPLVIVDNFPYEGDMNNINPNDVENITLLKDAGAASIWGTKAGNGVIVITTKKGRFNQPLQVEFNANISFAGKPDIFKARQISSTDYIDVEQMLFKNGYFDSFLPSSREEAVSPVVEILDKVRNGLISSADAESQINALRKVDTRNQYKKYFYQEKINQQYSLSLRGGNNSISYFISGGYDKNVDNLNTKYNRVNLHFENSYKPTQNLFITFGTILTNSHSNGGKPEFDNIRVNNLINVPYINLVDKDGNPLPVAQYRQGYIDTAGRGKLMDWNYYPLTDWRHNYTNTTLQDLTANLGIHYQIIKGLSFDLKYFYEKQQSQTKHLEDIQSFAARDYINKFSQLNSNTDVVKYIVPPGGILNFSHASGESQNIRGQINFSHAWNNHNVVTMFGGEIRQSHTIGNSNTTYGYNDNLLSFANVDFVNFYPTYIDGSSSTINNGVSFSDLLNRFVSIYANAAYTFKGRYTVSASGRRDASNLFGVSTNNKWVPLWSAGASWDISKEPFYRSAFLSYLKLRATYGFSGNADPSHTGITTYVYSSSAPLSNLPYARPLNFPNPELRWEKIGTFNIGIDFATRNNFISGSLEYYHKRGFDLFGPAPLDYTTGLNASIITINAANMVGNGLDIALRAKLFNGPFTWQPSILFSYYTDKITKYYVPQNTAQNNVKDGITAGSAVGRPVYSIVSYKWGGLSHDAGDPQGFLDGRISTDYYSLMTSSSTQSEIEYNGPALPKYYGSFINSFNWRQLFLTINLLYKFGYYFREIGLSYSTLYANGAVPGSSEYANRWQKPGDELSTNIPSMVYPSDGSRDLFYQQSSATVLKADNIRIQFINIGYDLTKYKWQKLPIEKATFYLNLSNLGIIWKANKRNIDPDYNTIIPPTKTFSIGLKVNF